MCHSRTPFIACRGCFCGVWEGETGHHGCGSAVQETKLQTPVVREKCKSWDKIPLVPPGIFHNNFFLTSVHAFIFFLSSFPLNQKSNLHEFVVRSRHVSHQLFSLDCSPKLPLLQCILARHCLTQSPSREKLKEAVQQLHVSKSFFA